MFRLQMLYRKVLGNSCFQNFLAVDLFLMVLEQCSYFTVTSLFHHLLANDAGKPQETSWDCSPDLTASTEQLEVN